MQLMLYAAAFLLCCCLVHATDNGVTSPSFETQEEAPENTEQEGPEYTDEHEEASEDTEEDHTLPPEKHFGVFDGGIGCKFAFIDYELLSLSYLPIKAHSDPTRTDVLVEKLMQAYHIGIFITLPLRVSEGMITMLPLMHVDVAISIQPDSADSLKKVTGPFEFYMSTANASEMLGVARKKHSGPAILYLDLVSPDRLKAGKVHEWMTAVLEAATDDDIVVIVQTVPILDEMLHDMCVIHPGWKIYSHGGQSHVFVLKSADLERFRPLDPVPPPPLVWSTEEPKCDPEKTKVDILLMTRNHPMQTYAFLESLANFASNINKVWVLYRADDDVSKKGYDLALSCAKRSLNVEGVRDLKGEFGSKVLEITNRSEAEYIVLGVDKMIWLKKIDFLYAACLLKTGEGAFSSFQLRLGENINGFPKYDDDTRTKRFFKMKHNPNVYAYYPLRLGNDFAFVVDVDGIMLTKANFLEDISRWLPMCPHPHNIKDRWIRNKLHIRGKQWHLMYTTSRVVSNLVLEDATLADYRSNNIHKKAHENAKKFVKKKMKIDVEEFARELEFQNPFATHINKSVLLVPHQC